MDKLQSASLDAEIERYRRQMIDDYRQAAPMPPPRTTQPPRLTTKVPFTPPPHAPAPPAGPAPVPQPEDVPTPKPEPKPVHKPAPAPTLTPEQEYAAFASENEQWGSIKTQVLTARGTYPVKDVTVVISKLFESGEHIISTQKTDLAGKTEPVAVPAPDSNLSEIPGSQQPPFASYKITFTHPSFATVVSTQLPVFSGVTAMQTINMIPTSATPNGSTIIHYVTTEPSDL